MIRTIDISKTYYQGKTKIEAVKGANLEVYDKESALIEGPSGAGKSTLLHLLGGLDEPTKGTFSVNEVDFYSLSDKERSEIRNEKIGIVFQFYHLLPEFSVLENVMLPALIRKKKIFKNNKDLRKRAEYLLSIVGLTDRINHRPSELSGGEAQRSALARALVNFPEVLLCDEPTGNLDSKTGEEVIESLWALKKKENMTLIIVSHEKFGHDDFDRKFKMQDGILEELKYGPQSLSEWQICKQK